MNRLFEIINDCNHENYLGEVIIPFLRSCCIEETKIVPVYDDRASGPKTDNETEIKKRMKTICAPKEDGGYAVPDYIFVPKEYSFGNPKTPYLMVETKKPILWKNGIYYVDLKNQIALAYEGESQLLDEKLNTHKSIDDIFKQAQTAFNTWSKWEPEDRTTSKLLRMLDFDFFELLDSVTIARSRKHIQKYYDTSDIAGLWCSCYGTWKRCICYSPIRQVVHE